MRRSGVPTWGSGVVLVAVLLAGCASASDPPPPRPLVTVATAPASSTAPRLTVSPLCRAPGTLTELSVTRTNPSPQNQISFVFPSFVTSTDATAIAGVARAACGLPDFPSGEYSCPADFGITYSLVFRSATAEVGTVTADPTGCPTLTGLGPTRGATPSFWDQLAVALGLPAPKEYCDPFRGRLPTAPTRCGPDL